MITRELAEQLRAAGLAWTPTSGDRFMVPDRDLDDEVFVVAGMAIESRELPSGGSEMRFNGTVEWALDSIEQSEVIWFPREEQMRHVLDAHFTRLERLGGETGGWAVVLTRGGAEERYVDIDPERAYARALLSVLNSAD